MATVTVRLRRNVKEALRDEAREHSSSMSLVASEAIESWLKTRRQIKPIEPMAGERPLPFEEKEA